MEIKEKLIKRKVFEVECQKCGKKIQGNSKSAVMHNLNIHFLCNHDEEDEKQ
jgi:hypothetical protein